MDLICYCFLAVAPVASGVLYAWSVASGLPFPFDHYFTFVVGCVVCVFLLGGSFLMPTSLDTPFIETEEMEEEELL